jgi:hypothetical protein
MAGTQRIARLVESAFVVFMSELLAVIEAEVAF